MKANPNSSLATPSPGSLQRIGGVIVSHVVPTTDFQLCWPVFRTITHLDLLHAQRWTWSRIFHTGISSLTSLQFLRLNAEQPRSFPVLQSELEPLIQLLPKSLLVILIRFWYDMSPWDKDNLWRFQNCDDGVDSRVLLVNHTYGDREEHLPKARFPWILNSLQFDDRKHWSLETNEDETFWGMALSLVKARQQALSLRS
ncbi:hypothetical protein DL96DRAFT_1812866 [Flagelloscypha sp. PMI_526]|nr:hypothetical protein DL96DRAFT_1812866 [Flagelloscypha sp. PMI_526]